MCLPECYRFELFLQLCFLSAAQAVQQGMEFRAVVEVAEVAEFVEDDEFLQVLRQQDKLHVEVYIALGRAGAPVGYVVLDCDATVGETVFAGSGFKFRDEDFPGFLPQSLYVFFAFATPDGSPGRVLHFSAEFYQCVQYLPPSGYHEPFSDGVGDEIRQGHAYSCARGNSDAHSFYSALFEEGDFPDFRVGYVFLCECLWHL